MNQKIKSGRRTGTVKNKVSVTGSGSANSIFMGSFPVRVQKIITVNAGLRVRFGFGSMPCSKQAPSLKNKKVHI